MNKNLILTVAIILCAILTGCPSKKISENVETIPTQITVAVKEDYTQTIQTLVREFEEQNKDVKVKLLQLPASSEDMHGILVSALCGDENDVDICETEDIWLAEFASRGYIYDLTDSLKIEKDKYIRKVYEGISYNGRIYAAPFELDLGMMYYRKDIVQNLNLDWEKLLMQNNEYRTQNPSMQLFAIQDTDGQDMICNALELIKYKNNNVEEGFKLYKKLIEANKNDNPTKDDYMTTFKSGKAVYMRAWASTKQFLSDDLSKARSVYAMKEITDSRNNPSAILKRYGLAINKDSNHIEESLKFLDFCMDRKSQLSLIKGKNAFPMLYEFYTDPIVIDTCPYVVDIKDSVDSIPTRKQDVKYMELSLIAQDKLREFLKGNISVSDAAKAMKSLIY